MTPDEPHLAGYRTHLPKRTMCLACPTVLGAGELVTWIYVEQDGKVFPGTSMFACLSHEAAELKFFAIPEVKRRADEARREIQTNVARVVLVRDEDEKNEWWEVGPISGDPHTRALIGEATRGRVLGLTPKP